MAEATMAVQIPDDAVREVVCAEVAKRLGDPEKLVAGWVERMLREKVRPRGDRYGRDMPRIEEEIDHLVKGIVESVIQETVEESRPELEAAIRKAMTVQKTARAIASSLVDALEYKRFKVGVNLELTSNSG